MPRTSGSIAGVIFGSDGSHIRYARKRSNIDEFSERLYNEWDWYLLTGMEHLEY